MGGWECEESERVDIVMWQQVVLWWCGAAGGRQLWRYGSSVEWISTATAQLVSPSAHLSSLNFSSAATAASFTTGSVLIRCVCEGSSVTTHSLHVLCYSDNGPTPPHHPAGAAAHPPTRHTLPPLTHCGRHSIEEVIHLVFLQLPCCLFFLSSLSFLLPCSIHCQLCSSRVAFRSKAKAARGKCEAK